MQVFIEFDPRYYMMDLFDFETSIENTSLSLLKHWNCFSSDVDQRVDIMSKQARQGKPACAKDFTWTCEKMQNDAELYRLTGTLK